MCLILTASAAFISALVFFISSKKSQPAMPFRTSMLLFGAAALMWTVDAMFAVREGEAFFDISVEDTILGLIIIAAGICATALVSFLQNRASSRARRVRA